MLPLIPNIYIISLIFGVQVMFSVSWGSSFWPTLGKGTNHVFGRIFSTQGCFGWPDLFPRLLLNLRELVPNGWTLERWTHVAVNAQTMGLVSEAYVNRSVLPMQWKMHSSYSNLHFHRCHTDTEREREIRVAQTMILLMEGILRVLYIPLFSYSQHPTWLAGFLNHQR